MDIFQEHGIGLLFHPAYSPYLNTCEFFFQPSKIFPKKEYNTNNKTEIATGKGILSINATNSFANLKACGYM